MKYTEGIVERIKKIKKDGQTVLVAIDGFGGSGKTSLARDLKNDLQGIAETTIVQLDDFYVPELKRADRKRVLGQVIQPLKNDKATKYQVYDWQLKKLAKWYGVVPGGIVIVEGVSAMHPEFGKSYDMTIWVDCSQDEAAQRGIKRDFKDYSIDTTKQWENDWMPQEKEYVEKFNPKEYADIIISTTKDLVDS